MRNKLIEENLRAQKESFLQSFKQLKGVNSLFIELFEDLQKFDFSSFKKQLAEEIRINLNEWWVNTDKGIIKEEKLYAVLFEYDYDIFQSEIEALSYGIGSWDDFETHTEDFDMGFNYDFSTEFEAAPGLTLKYYNPLEKLAEENLPDDLKTQDLFDQDGYHELINSYTFSGLVAIHEVFVELEKSGELNKLNRLDGFMILIGEHDSGEVYPVLIKE